MSVVDSAEVERLGRYLQTPAAHQHIFGDHDPGTLSLGVAETDGRIWVRARVEKLPSSYPVHCPFQGKQYPIILVEGGFTAPLPLTTL